MANSLLKTIIIALLISCLSCQMSMSQLPDKKVPIRFLALGDSYTIGESVDEHHRWPVQLTRLLTENGYVCDPPTIIARTGWRTDDLSNAINEADIQKKFNLVSLLIGVNNQYQGKSAESYEPEFEKLLLTAIDYAGGKKSNVFVVSIPDYGCTPFGKENSVTIGNAIDTFNAVNKRITDKYGITYVDITPVSRRGVNDETLVAEDGLHPSGKMYFEWTELIFEKIKRF